MLIEMKKIAFIIAFATIVSSCTGDLSDFQNSDDLIPFDLSLSGEVSTIEEPLTKSEESKALLGIQVYQNGSPYAWGLFDNTNGLSIYLHSGSEYSIICQYIKNGKETLKLFNQSTDATTPSYILNDQDTYKTTEGTSSHPVTVTHTYWKSLTSGPKLATYNGEYYNFHRCSNGYGKPFNLIDHYSPGGSYWCTSYYKKNSSHYERSYDDGTVYSTYTVCAITNGFVYDNTNTINVASSNVTMSPSSSESIDRYYGESGTFIASPEYGSNIMLDMKHLVYILQCNVTGVSDGTASISIWGGGRTLFSKDSISGEYHSGDLMFAISDMQGAWQYSDNYIENVTINMKWMRGVGVLQDLGSQVVQVKRNSKNVINVSLSTVIPASSAASEKTQLTDTNIVRAEFSINNVMQ